MHRTNHTGHLPNASGRLQIVAALMACIFALAATTTESIGQVNPATTSSVQAKPDVSLTILAQHLHDCLELSRPVLLGSRDASGGSCLPVVRSGDVKDAAPGAMFDLDGGPGSRLATLYMLDRQRVKSPHDDFVWHQGRLRSYLNTERHANAEPFAVLRSLLDEVAVTQKAIASWQSVPAGLGDQHIVDADDWCTHCLFKLNQAVASQNLDESKRWINELEGAVFSLGDLHRWLEFLTTNQLAGLDFQARCEPMFPQADPNAAAYDIQSSITGYPAGILSLNGLPNYYEVERRAETLFFPQHGTLDDAVAGKLLTATSAYVPPLVRTSYAKVRDALSPANRATLERAAGSRFEHSYLANMLYRAAASGSEDQFAGSMRRFDKNHPEASMAELMDVMNYRGVSFGGIEWDDRYHPQIIKAAEQISKADPTSCMLAAHEITNNFFRTPVTYAPTYTLRDALEHNKLDCTRATDMMAALYRDSGHGLIGNIRLCGGNASHSVGAFTVNKPDGSHTYILDGMSPSADLIEWPIAYSHGLAWPPTLASNPQPYAAELYLRGLDGYIWAEGVVLQGPSAGAQNKAAIPYLPDRMAASSQRAFGAK